MAKKNVTHIEYLRKKLKEIGKLNEIEEMVPVHGVWFPAAGVAELFCWKYIFIIELVELRL